MQRFFRFYFLKFVADFVSFSSLLCTNALKNLQFSHCELLSLLDLKWECNALMQHTVDADKLFLKCCVIGSDCHGFWFTMIVQGTSYENMTIIVQNYVESLIAKYPYWNRTLGADHFFVTCHDVGVRATEGLPLLVKNSIRVVCSPSYDVGFIPHKDVALPQVLQPFALPAGGNDVENR